MRPQHFAAGRLPSRKPPKAAPQRGGNAEWRARVKDVPPVYQQTGIIAFSRSFLDIFGRLERTPLEMVEQIDMMRTLEHGYDIRIVVARRETIGVDTPADRDRAEGMLRADPVTRLYMDLPA